MRSLNATVRFRYFQNKTIILSFAYLISGARTARTHRPERSRRDRSKLRNKDARLERLQGRHRPTFRHIRIRRWLGAVPPRRAERPKLEVELDLEPSESEGAERTRDGDRDDDSKGGTDRDSMG
mmetsp:Transcript_30035/g.55192  ORF Transcript_30035/g.55192 Transcript_30035/m.55192 type:complete len:124 (-) Transcript_30035:111-482(-)